MARAMREPLRCFDLRDELRATAHRRRPGTAAAVATSDLDSLAMRGEGTAEIAARLAAMFTTIPQDTIQGVLSELFRASPHCSREELADAAVNALLDMGAPGGGACTDQTPQAITCFSPRVTGPNVAQPALSLPEGDADGDGMKPGSVSGSAVADDATDLSDDPDNDDAPLTGSSGNLDELLDACLAGVLSLPDEAIPPCVQTLGSALERIAQDPGNLKVRRLRLSNTKFVSAIGQHEAAVELLRLAGFEDDGADSGDPALVFRVADPAACAGFCRVREAVQSIAEDLCHPLAATASRASPSSSGYTVAAPSAPSRISATAKDERRRRVAALTEQRLRDPAAFREQARNRGAAQRGGGLVRRAQRLPQAPRAAPSRRAQHFTLSDVERMRVADDIANTPSYADEYRRNAYSSAASDYATLVSRTYDPELIAREALDGTNKYRASKGLPPLRWHDGIARIARQHAESMASGAATFSHDGFDARVKAFPVAHRSAAENLAYNHGISAVAQCAVDGWIKSPGHEKNLRGHYNLCGIGVGRSPQGAFYLTQLFASTG